MNSLPSPAVEPFFKDRPFSASYSCTLAIVPPRRLWPAVQAIRREYHSVYERWPPHINLVYPFLPEVPLLSPNHSPTTALTSPPSNPTPAIPTSEAHLASPMRSRGTHSFIPSRPTRR